MNLIDLQIDSTTADRLPTIPYPYFESLIGVLEKHTPDRIQYKDILGNKCMNMRVCSLLVDF